MELPFTASDRLCCDNSSHCHEQLRMVRLSARAFLVRFHFLSGAAEEMEFSHGTGFTTGRRRRRAFSRRRLCPRIIASAASVGRRISYSPRGSQRVAGAPQRLRHTHICDCGCCFERTLLSPSRLLARATLGLGVADIFSALRSAWRFGRRHGAIRWVTDDGRILAQSRAAS